VKRLTPLVIALVFLMLLSTTSMAASLAVLLKDGSTMVLNVPVPDEDIDSVLMLYSDQIMIMEPADVAYVNGESISRQDFVSRMEDAAGYHILDEMINELLIRQAAEQAGITVTPDEVEIEMQNLRISYGSDYESVLWEYNMTEDELWTNIELDLLTIKYSTKDLVVNEADLRDYFRLYKADFAYPEMIRASHILVDTETKAWSILEQLEAGKSFAELAEKWSIDRATAVIGGDLDWFERGVMIEPFEDAAFSMWPGEISRPVKSEVGYHIILVTDRMAAREAVFEEVRDEVKKAFLLSKAPTVNELAEQLRDEAEIIVLNDKFWDLGTVIAP
jgi:foldase protein PrsA